MKSTWSRRAVALALAASAASIPACGRPSPPVATPPTNEATSAPAAVTTEIAAAAERTSDDRSPPAAPKPTSSLVTAFLGDRDPNDGHPEIVGVDREKRRVWVRRQRRDETVVIDTIDLVAESLVETWASDPKRRLELTGFKRLAFQPLSGSLADDLVRYARIVVGNDERSLDVPALSVSADKSKIAFLVKGGPRLQVAIADGEGKNVRLIGAPSMRGEHPSVSPDGRWLAFSACEKTATNNDCPRSLFVVDLRDPKLAPRKLSVAWPAAVAWDADSAGLSTTQAIALARASGDLDLRRSCLVHVKIEAGEARPIVCAEDAYDTQLAVSPDRKSSVFVVMQGEPPRLSFDLRTCDLGKGECAAPFAIRQLVEPPLLTDEGVVHAAIIPGTPWSLRLAPREERVVADVGWMTGARRLDGQTFVRTAVFRDGYGVRTISGTAPITKP